MSLNDELIRVTEAMLSTLFSHSSRSLPIKREKDPLIESTTRQFRVQTNEWMNEEKHRGFRPCFTLKIPKWNSIGVKCWASLRSNIQLDFFNSCKLLLWRFEFFIGHQRVTSYMAVYRVGWRLWTFSRPPVVAAMLQQCPTRFIAL